MTNHIQVRYEFAEFLLDPAQKILLREGQPLALTPKRFDTLLLLVENSGRILEKDELMKALWPESFVEEGNLSQNIFALRRILGDDQNGNCFIQTIPRRGYKFVAPVKQVEIPTSQSLSADYWSGHSPFRGLQVFEPDDAWLFFGRDLETEDLLSRLGRSPVLAVIGNSGCGKSSLVRAGLIPALRAGRFHHGENPVEWRMAIIRPSGAPFDYLAEVLPNQLTPELSLKEQSEFIADCRNKLPLGREALRNALSALANATAEKSDHARILLVVDQFEELFTLTTTREVRQRYIDALLTASCWDGCVPIHLALVLRADFYSHCLEYPGLSRCLENNLYNVPRMTHDQFRETIEKRLALAGTRAESGLIDSLLDDVGAEPGDLALLEHALSQLWEKCGGFGRTLTNTAYAAIGRLRGALSAHADEVYREITGESQKQFVQTIFLALVHFGEGAPDTRHRVQKAELLSLGAPEEVEPLLTRLTSSRLISISGEGAEAFAEVSHEALIREWSTLREWIAQNREELHLERRLVQAAQEWEDLNYDAGALLQGARLAHGEEWLLRHPTAPALVREFLQASLAARVEAEERELRRLRWFSCILASLLLVALGATWFAHKQQVLAQSRALAAQSEEMLTRDQGRALDLALRGWNTAKTQETYTAFTKAWPQTLSVLGHDDEVGIAVFSPDSKRILTASYDHTVRLWDTTDGRLLAILQGHNDRVEGAAFSADGQRIVTASWDHTARVWDTANGRLLVILEGHTDAVIWAEFYPDGQRIVTASADHTARVWNTADGRLLATLHGHAATVWDAKFSPDGQRIVTASLDHTARVWSTTDGHLLATLQGHTNYVNCSKFSPDAQRIVTASYDHTARIWNATDGRLLAILHHDGPVRCAMFSPSGQRIVTAGWDHTARVWNTTDGRLLATLRHEGKVNHAEFSPDGQNILTASYDHTARIWNGADGRLLATLQGHSGAVMHAAFSPDGRSIVTGSKDHTARVWNSAGGRLLAALLGHTDFIYRSKFSPDGQRLVTASYDHTARVWNTPDGHLLTTLQGHSDAVWDASFSPDCRYIVTASQDHTARVWNAADGRLLAILHGHTDDVMVATFSPDGQRIVTASWDHTARVWNASDRRLLATLQGHTDKINAATFSPDSQRIVTASWDHTARVWSSADGRLLATLQGHTDRVLSAAFSPDGQRIVTTSADRTARIWNTADGHLVATLQGHTDIVRAALFSPDGQRIVTASADHTARVWNSAGGRLLAILVGHTNAVMAATFSPDGQGIVTASWDHTARVWNSADGRLLTILQGHTDAVATATFSPDGQRIVTAGLDQTARIWQVLTLEDIKKILKD